MHLRVVRAARAVLMLALHCAGHPQDEWATPALLTAQPNRKIGDLGQRVRSTLLWGRAYSVVEPKKRHTRTPARHQLPWLRRATSSCGTRASPCSLSPFSRTDGGLPGGPPRGEVYDPPRTLCPWQSHHPLMGRPRLARLRASGPHASEGRMPVEWAGRSPDLDAVGHAMTQGPLLAYHEASWGHIRDPPVRISRETHIAVCSHAPQGSHRVCRCSDTLAEDGPDLCWAGGGRRRSHVSGVLPTTTSCSCDQPRTHGARECELEYKIYTEKMQCDEAPIRERVRRVLRNRNRKRVCPGKHSLSPRGSALRTFSSPLCASSPILSTLSPWKR
jgi:hypothetical protein